MEILASYLKEARKLQGLARKKVHQRNEVRLRLLFLLLDLKAKDVVWRKKYKTWKELLRTENLCPISVFQRFEQAVKLLGPDKVELLGATASSTLASTPKSCRQKLIKATEKWCQNATPSHAEISRYVWQERKQLAPPKEKVKRSQLLAYIEALEALLRSHKIEPPSFPS